MPDAATREPRLLAPLVKSLRELRLAHSKAESALEELDKQLADIGQNAEKLHHAVASLRDLAQLASLRRSAPAQLSRELKEALRQQTRLVRISAGITQPQLAKAAGVTVSTISHWETGSHSTTLRIVIKIVRGLLACAANGRVSVETLAEVHSALQQLAPGASSEGPLPVIDQSRRPNSSRKN